MNEYKLDKSNLTYIIIDTYVIFSNNVKLELTEFQRFVQEKTLLDNIKKFAKLSSRLYSYEYAKQGQIRKLAPSIVQRRTGKPQKVNKQKKVLSLDEIAALPSKTKIHLNAFSASLGAFAAGASIISIYHMTLFWMNGGKGVLISLLIGFLLVCFASAAFAIADNIKESKALRISLRAVAAAVVLFITFCTCSVTYLQFRDNDTAHRQTALQSINKNELYTDTQEALKQAKSELARLRQERNWKIRKKLDISIIEMTIDEQRKRISILEDKASAYKEQAVGTIKQQEEQSKGSFTFLAEILHIQEITLRIIAYSAAAIFFDVIAPICWSAFSIFYKRGKNGK